MKLLILEPGLRLWGSERALLATLPALLATYEEVTLLTSPDAELAEAASKLGATVENAPIGNLHHRGLLARGRAFISIVMACRRHAVDVIYLNQAGLCRLVVLVGCLLRRPIVIHVRLLEDIPRCARLRPSKGAPISLVFVSRDMLHRYVAIASAGERKRRVMAYDVLKGDWQKMRGSLDRPLSIACLGRIEAAKGQRELVEALGLLAADGCTIPTELLGALDEDDAYVCGLRARISELHLSDLIAIRGYISDAPAVLARHRFAVVSSRYESFGRVVAEAWAAGTIPIVSSESGGAAELVRASGGGLLFEGHSPKQLAATLAKAASLDKADRRRLIELGRRWAQVHLSMDAYHDALRGVLFQTDDAIGPLNLALIGATA